MNANVTKKIIQITVNANQTALNLMMVLLQGATKVINHRTNQTPGEKTDENHRCAVTLGKINGLTMKTVDKGYGRASLVITVYDNGETEEHPQAGKIRDLVEASLWTVTTFENESGALHLLSNKLDKTNVERETNEDGTKAANPTPVKAKNVVSL